MPSHFNRVPPYRIVLTSYRRSWIRYSSCQRYHHGLLDHFPSLGPVLFEVPRADIFHRTSSLFMDIHPLSFPRRTHSRSSSLQLTHALCQCLESNRFTGNQPTDDRRYCQHFLSCAPRSPKHVCNARRRRCFLGSFNSLHEPIST